MQYQRYAIFYTPAPGPPADFGAAWLGWDPVHGRRVAQCVIDGVDVPEITETPRKYGFHGTIKPPFVLAEGQSEAKLRVAFAGFCETTAPVTTEALELAKLGSFLALQPGKPSAALLTMAADVVRGMDGFRVPLTGAQMARRRARKLSPEQDKMLERWGYPYVIDEFRFHMTLTGRVSKAQAGRIMHHLRLAIAPMIAAPFRVDALSLMGEDAAGMFHLIARCALGGGGAG
ncbi:Uncharacterized protein Atu0170, clustered with phosphonate utilization [hydrothermal vent metagenome]|uniref:Uncharacterized protein Atu0170, clustered with phosphonate utilization n=1 Tax=hydrothermal vent metagenome TaxID=652676 RepID=A0A3B0RCF7_9ZZZZ